MHQLAKADKVDYGTRLVIADTIIICGKVAAYIHDRTDDPYFVGSIKHLENYSESMAARILNTKIGNQLLLLRRFFILIWTMYLSIFLQPFLRLIRRY